MDFLDSRCGAMSCKFPVAWVKWCDCCLLSLVNRRFPAHHPHYPYSGVCQSVQWVNKAFLRLIGCTSGPRLTRGRRLVVESWVLFGTSWVPSSDVWFHTLQELQFGWDVLPHFQLRRFRVHTCVLCGLFGAKCGRWCSIFFLCCTCLWQPW